MPCTPHSSYRGFARTSIHVLCLMTDSCRPKKVCKSVVERPRASERVKRVKKKEREKEEEALEARGPESRKCSESGEGGFGE